MKNNHYFIGLWLLFLVSGCGFKSMYEGSVDIPKEEWNKNQVIKFEIPVTDTINGYRVVVNVRNSNEYPYSNIFLFLTTYAPNGKSIKDTLEMTLADDRGKWQGKGFGGIWSTDVPLRRNATIRFPASGTYKVEVVQAMRDEVLKGIKDIGIRIEKENK